MYVVLVAPIIQSTAVGAIGTTKSKVSILRRKEQETSLLVTVCAICTVAATVTSSAISAIATP